MESGRTTTSHSNLLTELPQVLEGQYRASAVHQPVIDPADMIVVVADLRQVTRAHCRLVFSSRPASLIHQYPVPVITMITRGDTLLFIAKEVIVTMRNSLEAT